MNGFTLNEEDLLKRYGQTKQLEIERLLSQYGTSLKDVREMYPQLTTAIEQKRLTTTFPTQPLFFTASEAAQMGLALQEGWMLKMSPTEGNGGFTSSLITPEKWEITENDLYISPSGDQLSRADMEALLGEPTGGLEATPQAVTIEDLTEEGKSAYQEYQGAGGALDVKGWVDLRERQQLETEQVFGRVFPEQDISEIVDYINTNPEGFLADIREIGRTAETEALLRAIDPEITEADLQEIFATAKVELGEPVILQPMPTDWAGSAQTWIEHQIGRELTFGEVLGSKRIPELQGHYYSAYLAEAMATGEELKEPMLYVRFRDAAKVFGQSLLHLPKQIAASVLQATQGKSGASVVNRDWADEFIAEANEDIDKFAQDVATQYPDASFLLEVAQVSRNLAYSITSMGAGAAVGVPVAFIPLPGARVAAWTAGTAASGAVAYQMTCYQIMQQYLEVMNEQQIQQTGKGLTLEEENKLKQDFSDKATQYGLWEAIPEAISNLAFAQILGGPLGKMIGGNLATKIIGKIVGIYGEELLTETITQKGQSDIEVEAGLREENISWVEAFKEIAPQTFLLTTIMAGAGQVIVSSSQAINKVRNSLRNEIGEGNPLYKEIQQGIETELPPILEAAQEEAGAVAEQVVPEVTPVTPVTPEIATSQEYTATVYRGYKEGGAPVDEGLFGKGTYYTTSQEYAETYDGKEVMTVNLKNPFVIQTQAEAENFWNETTRPARQKAIEEGKTIEEADELAAQAARDYLEKQGYDGLIARNIIEKGDEIVVFHPEKVTGKAIPTTEAGMPEAETPVEPVEVSTRRQLEGLGRMYQEWWSKRRTADETKAALAKFVKENLPMDARGKFITAVAKVKTDAQLAALMTRVMEFAESNAQKVLKAEVRAELKKARAKVKDHILKGKFTPETQRLLDVLNHNLELDRDAAREKIVTNIRAYESGELSYEEMFKANEALNFAGIDGMSSEELTNLLDYIKSLETIGRSERQAKWELATEKIKAASTDISNILTGGKGLKTGIGAVSGKQLAAKPGWLDTFVNWQYGIDNLADKLSKFDTTSKPYQSVISEFVSQVHRATNRQFIGTKEAYIKVKDAVGEVFGVKGGHAINQVLNELDTEVNLGTFELTAEYIANHPGTTTVTIKMTRNEMLAKYMQMQDRTLDNTFTTGMGWSMEVRNAIENNLTAEEKKLVDSFFQFYEDYYNTINPIYQELYNVDMPHNPRYSPIRRDFEADIAENVLTFQDAAQYASVLNGSLKARQRNIRPLRFNGATQILSNHIEQMEHFKAWAITMRDMRRVFGNAEIRQAIEQYHGRGIIQLIDKFMNQMARGGIETAATNRVADWLRRNFTRSILAIKPVIALKQILSLFAYVSDQEMGVAGFVSGIADFWTSPIAHFQFLYKNSEGFRARIQAGFERDIAAALAQHGNKEIAGQGSIKNWFMLQIRLGDTFAVTQGMWAKYRDGLNKGLSQTEAIAAAEDLTNRTQPSFGIDSLSAIQNGGSWLKLMTMFQNQPNKYFRMVGDNLRNFKYGRGSRAKASRTILLAWVILPMMFQFIADAFQWKPERQARAGILGPLNFILIGGQLVQSIWGWLTNEPFDYQVSPVAQTADDLRNIFLKAKKLISQGQDPYKDISLDDVAALVEYLAKAAGQITGWPTPYLVQTEKAIRTKLQEGEDINIKDFLFSQWALKPPAKNAEQKVEDLNLKLGEVKEGQEDKPLSERELNLYTTIDWFRDIGNVYSNVLPQDILDNPAASKESKAWAEYEIAHSQADILPNVALYQINTEDNDDTIINYYQQWKARERITNLAQLKEFDALYPKAYLGNVTRQQYELLVKYLESDDKDAFLDSHPELRINPRDEWLKANPIDNARLALAGKAKLLTLEAYNQFKGLLETLDIPTDAIPPMTLPPEGSVENYFKYGEVGEEYGWNSAEIKLLLVEDDVLREWLGRQEIDTPKGVLELQIKWRDAQAEYDALDTPETRDQYLNSHPEFRDDRNRMKAMDYEFPEALIEDWVAWYAESRSGYEDDWWLMEHPEFCKAMYDLDIWTEERDFSKVPTRDVYSLYKTYMGLPTGQPRLDFRAKHLDLDDWLVKAKGYTPVGNR